ncbi:hypothetical protein KIF24_09975 [Micromonospora sp. Llam7]|uniref:NAD(P)-dependent oxidoreductase n=1 Tax=Micromonospora tarapacensis TaxID=2835305 RepID=UPI001C82A08F|nr:NAD(P)-dependent oxidoreductase [Micromonospora tarapacensis]MBX7266318.1 hypothetical protein [Micromonospora tarapacensis]
MGPAVARALRAAHPRVRVDVVPDVSVHPPQPETIDVLVANRLPDGLLSRCTRLSWLHLTGTGTDHLAAAGAPPGLRVTTSATVPVRAVAEFAWMAVLALAKDAPRLRDQQRERRWSLPDARLVSGSRLLLLGLGRIGSAIAELAAPFGVRVTAVTRSARPSPLAQTVLPPHLLRAAATDTDHLVSTLPSDPSTRGLVDRQVIEALPDDAVVVNVGRADTLDTPALVAALRAGRLRGAVLDVHDEEPLPPDSPLWEVPGLFVTPHGAYRFPQEEHAVAKVFLAEFTAWSREPTTVDQGAAACPFLARTGVIR